MKKSAKSDLRAQTVEDLSTQVAELEGGLLKARMAQALQGQRRGLQYRNARRQIARLQTLIGEKRRSAK